MKYVERSRYKALVVNQLGPWYFKTGRSRVQNLMRARARIKGDPNLEVTPAAADAVLKGGGA